jgi:hypothetical protein
LSELFIRTPSANNDAVAPIFIRINQINTHTCKETGLSASEKRVRIKVSFARRRFCQLIHCPLTFIARVCAFIKIK